LGKPAELLFEHQKLLVRERGLRENIERVLAGEEVEFEFTTAEVKDGKATAFPADINTYDKSRPNETLVSVQHDVSERHEPGDAVTLSFRGAPVTVMAKS